jgi:hypothetical protein
MIIDQLFTRPLIEAIQPGADTVASVKKLWQYINRNLTDLASNASFYDERGNQPYIEDRLANLLKTSDGDAVTIAFDMGGNLEFDNNVLYVPVGNMWRYRGLIYGADFVKRVVGLLSKQTSSLELNEFARGDGPDRGNYLKELARAWYNMDFELLAHIARQGGNPMKHRVDVQETIERMLERGIHCGDGRVRKYYIGYNSDFDGVEIQSHDHYEHSDYDDDGTDIDDRTGKPWGPYDVVEFSSDELDESINEATDPKRAKLERMIYKYFGQIYDYGDDDGLNYLDEQGDLWNQLMDKYNGEIDDIVAQEPIEVLMQAAQELKGIAGDMKYELDEAAQGHTIEAHGVRGMDRRTWHKTFRNTDQMIAWAEKHDAEIVGTRDLEQARHHNLSPARQDMAEGRRTGEYSRVLRALGLYYPDKFSMEELNTPDWHRVIAYKADVPVEYAGKVINDFTRPYDYNDEWPEDDEQDVTEGSDQQLSVRQLATISDEALDKAYGYGRSSPGNTFGWQANLKSAAYAKHMIDKGVTDIDEIADAIHKGWNVTAKAFVKNPDRFDDTEKLKAAGKLEAKLQQRAKLMNIDYSQLPDDEQEKDRVVARALLQAITGGGEQDITEGHKESYIIVRTDREGKRDVFAGNFDTYERAQKELDDCLAHPLHTKYKQKFEIKRKGHKDITEMDKSEPSAGRDTGPRSGPDREAKPITAKKATKDAADMLTRAVRDAHKKKDVKEGSPAELARTAPGIKMAKMAGQSAVAAAKNKLDSLRARNPEQWDKAMQSGSARIHGVPPQFPSDAGLLMGDRAEWMKKVKSAPSEWDDTTGSIGMDPLMKKLQAAMVQEGRVKELADDLKTMSDADFMKKYGKAKAAIRKDMKRVDEAGISRLGKKDIEPEFDFRKGLVGDDQTGYETQNEPELGTFRMGKRVEPNDAATKEFIAALTPNQQDNRFTAPAGWRYVEKDEDPARYGSGPAAATSALPNLIYDPQSRTLKSADAPALDLSPKSKYKFDRTTQSQVPADGSGANANIDNATRDRARAYAAQQNAPAAAAKQKVDWKAIYALNKATIGSNPNVIRPRMQLNMPNGTIYMVQPGDTLTKIAAKQNQVNELSTEKLAQYKTAAARDARAADQEGDFKRGDRRFSGIVKATKKQFDNDAKKVDESRAARRALMARIVNHR